MKFDMTVHLGHVAIVITLVMGIITAWTTYQVTIVNMDMRLKFIEAQMKGQSQTNTDLNISLSAIQRDLAVIRDRLDRDKTLK